MKQIYSDIIQFRGNHYDFGKEQGLMLKDSFILKNREKQKKVRRPRFIIEEREVHDVFMRFAPQIWDEFLGLQEGLKWDLIDILQEFGGYRLDYKRSGCSIFTGEDYMIRNYDYHPKTYEGRFTLFQPIDRGYAVIGPSQRITGRMDGMNEKGLAMGYNFMHRLKPGDGFICNMIGRIILETCATVGDAIELLKEIPHRHSFGYTILDQQGKTYIVEASPRQVQVRVSNMCTNHFELLLGENRYHLDDSKQRMNAMQEQERDLESAYQAFRMLNDPENKVFSKKYKNWAGTIHTAAYFPKDKKVWFALGGNREPLTFDFENWLKGEDIQIRRVLGMVDTELSFIHMEENVR